MSQWIDCPLVLDIREHDYLAWMLCKKPYIVPIPGTRKWERLIKNRMAAEILLAEQEVAKLDRASNEMEMSEVFGDSRIKEKKEN